MNDLLWLSGTWFLAASNLELWTKGEKEAATYTFTPAENDSDKWLEEEIKYVQDGEVSSIYGDDFPHELNFRSFIWKGKGEHEGKESRWEVKITDETGLWILTWAEKNDRAPEHVHLLVKETQLDDDTFAKIKKLMSSDAVLQKHVGSLKKLL